MTAWMNLYFNSNTKLTGMIIPGSHDAGIAKESATGDDSARPATITQDLTIYEQLLCGCRFFDVRLEMRTGQASPTSFHRAFDKYGGMSGDTWKEIITSSVNYLKGIGAGDFIILKLTHTQNVDSVAEYLLNDFNEYSDYLFKSRPVNIAQCPFSILKNKIIIVTDSSLYKALEKARGYKKALKNVESGSQYKMTDRAFNIEGTYHQFNKYKPGAIKGLSACGKYADSEDVNSILKKQLSKVGEHKAHSGGEPDHLFMLYWTQTLSKWHAVRGHDLETLNKQSPGQANNGFMTGGAHHTMGTMLNVFTDKEVRDAAIKSLFDDDNGTVSYKRPGKHFWNKSQKIKVQLTHQDRLEAFPNIFIMDYVDPSKCQHIIELNSKNLQEIA